MSKPISACFAWRMRARCGYGLNILADYADPRVKEIAILQEFLQAQFNKLDDELKQLAIADGWVEEEED